jgi:hypothetical protein
MSHGMTRITAEDITKRIWERETEIFCLRTASNVALFVNMGKNFHVP